MKGKVYANPTVQEALRRKRAADSALRRTLRECQEVCSHDRVIEAPGRSGEYFGPMPAQRLCLSCGLEEYATWGTEYGGRWGPLSTGPCSYDRDWNTPPKLVTEFVKRVSREDFQKYRISHK